MISEFSVHPCINIRWEAGGKAWDGTPENLTYFLSSMLKISLIFQTQCWWYGLSKITDIGNYGIEMIVLHLSLSLSQPYVHKNKCDAITFSAVVILHWEMLEMPEKSVNENIKLVFGNRRSIEWTEATGKRYAVGRRAANCLAFFAEWAEAFKETNKAVCNRMEHNLSVSPSQPNICYTENLIITNLLAIHRQLWLSDFHFSPMRRIIFKMPDLDKQEVQLM